MNASDYLSAAEIKAIEARDQSFGDGESEGEQAAHDRAALLRHLRALTGSADGEVLGRELGEVRARLFRRAPDGYEGRSSLDEEMAKIDRESALHLHAIGHAAGALSREGEIAALREAKIDAYDKAFLAGSQAAQESIAETNAGKDATIARLTAELESLHADTAQHADEVAALTRQIVSLTAELADRDATIAILRHSNEELQRRDTIGQNIVERWTEAEEAAHADGAREERRLCAKIADDETDSKAGQRIAERIRARGGR